MTQKIRVSKLALVMLAALVVCAGPAAATYDSAVAAFEAGAYDEARREFGRLARNGDDRARYYLGIMHKDGNGVASDPVGALVWFLCAATNTSEFADEILLWRVRLTAHLAPSVVIKATRAARHCRSGAIARRDLGDPVRSAPGVPPPDRVSDGFNARPMQQWSVDGHGRPAAPQPALWFRIFYFPARASINGLEFLADRTEIYAFKRDLDLVIGAEDGVVMRLFALLWWILILRTLLRFSRSVQGSEAGDPPGGIPNGATTGWRRE